jgi:bifunctional non-homologous end joining protein LigD
LIGNRRSGGLCLATGAHPAPRQERILYQPLARTDDGLGRPRWRRFGAGNLTRLCPGGAGISEIMSLGPRSLPAGFIAPCLPTSAPLPPSGESWLHEIKHDGFRVIARKVGERVRLYSRPGNDLTYRFPLIVEALDNLHLQSCIIDGEAVSCGDDGIASFDRIRYRRHDADVFMWAFDLIELNGDDVRRDPLAVRKATLERILARAAPGIRFNEHLDHEDGPLVFEHACKLGLEGIVSKRRDSVYSSGRSPHWIKSKNPSAPAVKREAEEDRWSRTTPWSSRVGCF